MHPELDIEEALQRDDLVFIDVRTPSEFGRASIPGAVNIPLFDDRQFRELGAIYRNRGEKAARLAGLALAAPKLPELVEQIRTASGAKTPLIYCWRGGLRSLSLYQILNLAGVPALRLRGGYRAFRRYVNARLRDFSLQSEILVLHGLTGVGKTALIRALARKGYAALDLEGLARHRGSVFGAVGIQPRSQRDFEALLLQKLQRFKDSPYLVLEGEGKRIGNIHLPPFLTRAMEEGKHLLLTAPLPVRVERILEDYLAIPPSPEVVEEIREALLSLRRRLGARQGGASVQPAGGGRVSPGGGNPLYRLLRPPLQRRPPREPPLLQGGGLHQPGPGPGGNGPSHRGTLRRLSPGRWKGVCPIMNPYNAVHALAAALRQSEEYKNYKEAQEALKNDPSAKNMLLDFRRQQLQLQKQQLSGISLAPEQVEKMKKLYEIISLNLIVRRFLEAEHRLLTLFQDIQKIIAEVTGEVFDPELLGLDEIDENSEGSEEES